MHRLEKLILVHCATVLGKAKPASIISCCEYDRDSVDDALDALRRKLLRQGCVLREVCRCEHHVTLFIYHRWMLAAFLGAPGVLGFLVGKGYDVASGMDSMVDALLERYRKTMTVPHEIGVFIGYPLQDVLEFERRGGKGYKLCRYWKVYSDEKEAVKLFDWYDRCRLRVRGLIESGLSFEEILKEIA